MPTATAVEPAKVPVVCDECGWRSNTDVLPRFQAQVLGLHKSKKHGYRADSHNAPPVKKRTMSSLHVDVPDFRPGPGPEPEPRRTIVADAAPDGMPAEKRHYCPESGCAASFAWETDLRKHLRKAHAVELPKAKSGPKPKQPLEPSLVNGAGQVFTDAAELMKALLAECRRLWPVEARAAVLEAEAKTYKARVEQMKEEMKQYAAGTDQLRKVMDELDAENSKLKAELLAASKSGRNVVYSRGPELVNRIGINDDELARLMAKAPTSKGD